MSEVVKMVTTVLVQVREQTQSLRDRREEEEAEEAEVDEEEEVEEPEVCERGSGRQVQCERSCVRARVRVHDSLVNALM